MIIVLLLMELFTLDAKHVGTRLAKPPLALHRFDVTLRNPSKQPRWLILPRNFPQEGAFELGKEESELQIYQLSPKVTFAEGVGGNFQTLKLPGEGVITLRGVTIRSWWEKPPKTVELEVLVARTFQLAGAALETQLAQSASGEDLPAPRDAGDERGAKFWHPEHPSEVAVEIESRVKVKVPLR